MKIEEPSQALDAFSAALEQLVGQSGLTVGEAGGGLMGAGVEILLRGNIPPTAVRQLFEATLSQIVQMLEGASS